MIKIRDDGLNDSEVQALLTYHLKAARAQTAPGSAHALDLNELRASDVQFWSAWDGRKLVGVGALKRISALHGEIKSMHTVETERRKGVGGAILLHIIGFARRIGLKRLSLETGSWDYFNAARQLYKRHGFVECPPFGTYTADPNSVFYTLELR